jgi:predicted O-methyltransferase YrrM
MPEPTQFPRSDRRIYDAYVAGRQSAALAVAVRLQLFEALDAEPRTEAALRDHLGVKERPLRSLLAALQAMGLVERRGEVLSASDDASDYLVRGKPGWLGGLIDLEVEQFLSPASLLVAMTEDRPSVYGDDDPWEAHVRDPERARRFTAAMHSVSERPAAGLAETLDLSGVRSLLDVGGGSGAISIALARRWPALRCIILDLPVVCPVAREYVEAAGLSDRVTAEPGDLFAEALPSGHDAILFSQIHHDWPPSVGRDLLRKAHAALPSGGLVLVHEKLVDDDGSGPLANALVNLDMLVWTEGQQYREVELRALFSEAGFPAGSVERHDTTGYWSVVLARKA